MDNLKIIEAITPSRIGGAEVYVTQLCQRLPEYDIEPVLFCPSGRTFVDYAQQRGLDPVTWKTRGKFDPATVVKLARLIKVTGSNAIHTHLSTASLLGAFAAKLAGVKSIAHVHGMNSPFCFKYSDCIVTVSEAVKQHLASQGLVEKVHVVYNGIDTVRFTPVDKSAAREQIGLTNERFIFGVFGRLFPEKGQQYAIRAFARGFRDDSNAVLLIVGQGRDLTDLRTLAEALGVSDRVEFYGFAEDVVTLVAACDTVIVPSLKEGFGLAAVEAMAMEKPVIASCVGGLPEIVIPEKTGILVDPGNSGTLAEAMMKMRNDPDSMGAMGAAGRIRALAEFDLNTQTGRMADLLINNVRG